MIAGDAMGRPMIEALEAEPDRVGPVVALRRHVVGRAVLGAGEGALLRAASRTSMIIDSIGSSEGGFNGMSAVGKDNPTGGSTGGLPRVAPMADVIVVDDDLEPAHARATARSARSPAAATSRSATTRTRRRRPRRSSPAPDGKRYVVAGDFARWEEDGTDHPARPRLGVHQLRRREDLPRGGRGRPQGPPRRLRRARRRRARRAVGQRRHRRRAGPARPPTSTLNEPARSWPATSPAPPRWSTRSSAPAGKPDYPWPPRRRRGRRASVRPDDRRRRPPGAASPTLGPRMRHCRSTIDSGEREVG